MAIWDVPRVSDQPDVSLLRWTVVRFKTKELQAEFVYGWDVVNSCGRVSSVITAMDCDAARLQTRTGRTYRLLGSTGSDTEGEYVFRQKYAELIALCAITRLAGPSPTSVRATSSCARIGRHAPCWMCARRPSRS